ncbi:MAG TPA: hypothetical protein VF069_11725 [Streptosporangiaceae bacterium]
MAAALPLPARDAERFGHRGQPPVRSNDSNERMLRLAADNLGKAACALGVAGRPTMVSAVLRPRWGASSPA